MRLSVLGPFPCGGARCECTKGGCDHLGACSPEFVAAARLRDEQKTDEKTRTREVDVQR